jgi:multidrug efflux pump
MKFTDIFIRRPVVALAISLLILLLGSESLRDMQVREYPEVTTSVIEVTTSYFGASPELIQGFITQPLEQAIAQADNVEYISSSSSLGRSSISATMKLNTDPNAALADILSQVNSVRSQLPSEAEDPTVSLSTGGGSSVIYISFTSDVLNSSQISDYLDRVVKPQLFTIPGVAKINLYGGIKFGLRVWVDPQRMAGYQLSANDLLNVMRANNYQSAPGRIVGMYTQFNVEANTQANSVASLENIVVATRDQKVVRLKDVAQVTLEKSRDSYRALANGENSVVVAIDPSPSANPLDITAEVRKLLPDIENQMPSTMRFRILYDATEAIEESINEVLKTIIEATLIVLVVITLFLGNLRAVIIPVITIPLSLIGVAVLMSAFGFTINLMTLLAMVLAIGLVVDDAIVVVENIDRHIKLGKPPYQAAIMGTREIALPVISMTLTLAAVYAPIALMGGLTGSLFKEFALTLAGSVFVSGVVALTLSPMMSSKLLKPHTHPNAFERTVENTFERVTSAYHRVLQGFIQNRYWVLAMGAFVFASLPVLFRYIPQELAPSEDRGAFMIIGTAPSSANLDNIENFMKEAGSKVQNIPGVNGWLAFAGVPASNQAFGVITLDSWSKRDASQEEIIKQTSSLISNVSGVSLSAFAFPELPGSSQGMPVQLVITTPNNFESLLAVADAILEKMRASPKFLVTQSNLAFDTGTVRLNINRDKAGAYGITMNDIASTLNIMLSDSQVNRVSMNGRSYEVISQVERFLRLNPERIYQYYVRSANKVMIPLKELVSFELIGQPRALATFNQLNSATLSAVPTPGIAMGDAIAELERFADELLPKGFQRDYLGESRQFIQEGSALFETFALALAVIFLVLATQFNSLRDPMVILVSVPLAICGALAAMAWGLSSLNIYAQVGLVTLIGLITKHGILICEVAKHGQLHEGKSRLQAVVEAAEVRLRPILMTTAAMIAGLIPLLFATGAGAESRFSIGIVIIAGLAIGTLFTLFVLPVIYTFIASEHQPLPKQLNSKGEAITDSY